MAQTIAIAIGRDRSRDKETHRLGHSASTARAQTWRTFAECHVNADGSGYIQVRRDDQTMAYFDFKAESNA